MTNCLPNGWQGSWSAVRSNQRVSILVGPKRDGGMVSTSDKPGGAYVGRDWFLVSMLKWERLETINDLALKKWCVLSPWPALDLGSRGTAEVCLNGRGRLLISLGGHF